MDEASEVIEKVRVEIGNPIQIFLTKMNLQVQQTKVRGQPNLHQLVGGVRYVRLETIRMARL